MRKIIILGLVIRVGVIFLSLNFTNFDLNSYLKVGQLTLQGMNIYPETARVHHPYFPFFLYIEAFAIYLKQLYIHPILFIKTLIIAFDTGIIYLVYLLSNRNLKSTFAYAINPIAILICGFHGQFDSIPLFFLLLAIYLAKKQELISILLLSMAIMFKTWPLFFAISIFRKLKNKLLFILVGIFPFGSILLYSYIFKTKIVEVVSIIFKHHSLFGIFGAGKIIDLIYRNLNLLPSIFEQRFFFSFFAFTFISFSLLTKRSSILEELLILLLFFYTFTTNFAVQYFLWLTPFLILLKPKRWLELNLLIAIYLLTNYASWYLKYTLEFPLTLIGLLIWCLSFKMLCGYRKKNVDLMR